MGVGEGFDEGIGRGFGGPGVHAGGIRVDLTDPADQVRVFMPASHLGRVMAIGPQYDWEGNCWTVLETGR